ncbi:hypothetical protein Tco_0232774 [Tanacetum coccineum]
MLALKQQIDSLKQNLSNQIKENESLLQTFTVFKNESKEKEVIYEIEIDLVKKIKELDNFVFKVDQSAQTVHMLTKPQVFYDDTHKQAFGYQNLFYLKKAQRIKPTLYDGSVISSQHVASPVIDDEETLILEELNQLSEDFEKRFVPQMELSVEQAFWLPFSNPKSEHPNDTQTSVRVEVPKELPNVSLVNTSVKKLKSHLASFDKVVKVKTIPDAITEGSWGFEHNKKVFNKEVIPFKNYLQTLVKDFENGLLNELNEVKMVFNQMEVAVDQCYVDKKLFKIEKKELKLENERLLKHITCQDVVNIVMHTDVKSDNVLPVQNTFLDDNIALDVLKMENDRLMELLVSQDLVHTAVNSLVAINDYKSMEKSYIEEYERNLKLAAELS